MEARATRDYHPARRLGPPTLEAAEEGVRLPAGAPAVEIRRGERAVRVTNLDKVFWASAGITKRELLQYYADVAGVLLPHLRDRAMVMKRYPDGAGGPHFFMKRAPATRPDWLPLCAIEHSSGNVIEFPIVQDILGLLWVVNLGCIDLNQSYARCDDVDRPDYLHFDLDPVKGAAPVPFERVREAALRLRETLDALGMPAYSKTSGSRGLHVYVPIVRGPTQKQVWDVARDIALDLARRHPDVLTAEYRVARRPPGHVLIDFNQNAWGRTLASVYSVRPTPGATVSTPVTWREIERGVAIEGFHLRNVPARVRRRGDLWAPLLAPTGRFDLESLA